MKVYVFIFLAAFFAIEKTKGIYHQENIVSVKQGEDIGGIWKSNIQWKAHWVKHWEVRKIYVPVWKKVWGPVDIREWIPLPKPPSN